MGVNKNQFLLTPNT